MEFRIVKNGTNNFTHFFDNKDVNLSDFEVVLQNGTFTIQTKNGANIPAYGVNVTDIILNAGSGDETFSNTEDLRIRLEAVGYTAYYNAGGGGGSSWGSITGDIEDQTDLIGLLDGKQNVLTDGDGIDIIGDVISVNSSIATSDELTALGDTKLAKDNGTTYDTNFIKTVTQAEYDAIGTPDATTLYFIV